MEVLKIPTSDSSCNKDQEPCPVNGSINLEDGCSQETRKVEFGKQFLSENGNNKSQNSSSTKSKPNMGDNNEGEELESAKAEMSEVREENERLKTMLHRIQKDYSALKLRFFDIIQQENSSKKFSEDTKPLLNTSCSSSSNNDNNKSSNITAENQESELVSLSLGRRISSPTEAKKMETKSNPSNTCNKVEDYEDELTKASLTLGFCDDRRDDTGHGSKIPSHENSLEESNKDEEAVVAGESWPPSKAAKTARNGDEEAQQGHVKRARVCVRARCDTPTMNDGCQWRKYGQKIAKGNPCPRAYYRCTVAPGCPVRKQVQRCAEDMSILITTYEGTHNHPLPISATAMASTTSVAASMLLSGSSSSSSSQQGLGPAPAFPYTSESLKFNSYDSTSKAKQIYSPTTNPFSPLHPTITLDLTTPPHQPLSASVATFSNLNKFITYPSSSPRLVPSATNFNFSSSSSAQFTNLSAGAWATGYHGYGSLMPSQVQQLCSTLNQATKQSSQDQFSSPQAQQQALTETLTKAIASDPSFQSVIAAAISTMVGSGNEGLGSGREGPGHKAPTSSSSNLNQAIGNNKPCAGYFSGLLSDISIPQIGVLDHQQNQPPSFSLFKGNSNSSVGLMQKGEKS